VLEQHVEVAMATTAVNIMLRNIHCSDEGDGPGSAEPYLWTVFFKVDGDTASAVSDYLVVRESESGLLPVMGGTYHDRFVRTPTGWRFARKELEHHIWGDMALKNGR
jgi:hypothetical protein